MMREFIGVCKRGIEKREFDSIIGAVAATGGRVLVLHPPRVIFSQGSDETIRALRMLTSMALCSVSEVMQINELELTESERLGVLAWNHRQSADFKIARSVEPAHRLIMPVGGCISPIEPELRAYKRTRKTKCGYLAGSVAIGVVIVDGPAGTTSKFTQNEITVSAAAAQAGANMLAGFAPASAHVRFALHTRIVPVNLNPATIAVSSADPHLSIGDSPEPSWRDDALIFLGYEGGIRGVRAYCRDLKRRLSLPLIPNWAYVAFIMKYPAFNCAYAGDNRIVLQYWNDGYGPALLDRVFAHESAHIFGAADEYTESKCNTGGNHGFLGVPNSNCEIGNPGSVPCLMKATDLVICNATRDQLGWRDTDADGVPDPIDDDTSLVWDHMKAANSPADFDFIAGEPGAIAKFAVCGDFDGDGQVEVLLAPDLNGTFGNDLWTMHYDSITNVWTHLTSTEGALNNDVDLSTAGYPARSAVSGDFDGDGRDEVLVVPEAVGSIGNDVWVIDYNPDTRSWSHMTPQGGTIDCDIDISSAAVPVNWAIAGDFDGDGRDEVVLAPKAGGSLGNDLWALDFNPTTRVWEHMSPQGGPINCDMDISSEGSPARAAAVGDFDGDGKDEIVIIPEASGSAGNDLWVMAYDSVARVWQHRGGIDLSVSAVPAKSAIAGDFDGDGHDELLVLPLAGGSLGNDLWCMKFNGNNWVHMTPQGGPINCDIDTSGSGPAVKFAMAGDFDGDGRDEVVLVPDIGGSAGNDIWIIDYDPIFGTWRHVAAQGPNGTDFDLSVLPIPIRFAVAGDFDGDARDEIMLLPQAPPTRGPVAWVLRAR